jgi:hypothetical protein
MIEILVARVPWCRGLLQLGRSQHNSTETHAHVRVLFTESDISHGFLDDTLCDSIGGNNQT